MKNLVSMTVLPAQDRGTGRIAKGVVKMVAKFQVACPVLNPFLVSLWGGQWIVEINQRWGIVQPES